MVVWGIGGSDSYSDLESFRDQMGLTFPILYDPGGQVLYQYEQEWAFWNTIYPQDWVIGVDGKVAYVNSGYEPDEIIVVLDNELQK